MRPEAKKPKRKGMLYTEQYHSLPSLAHTVHHNEGRELLLPKFSNVDSDCICSLPGCPAVNPAEQQSRFGSFLFQK